MKLGLFCIFAISGSQGSLLISQNEWMECWHWHFKSRVFRLLALCRLSTEKHFIRWVIVVEAISCVLMIMARSVPRNQTQIQPSLLWIEKRKKLGIMYFFCWRVVVKMKSDLVLMIWWGSHDMNLCRRLSHRATRGQVITLQWFEIWEWGCVKSFIFLARLRRLCGQRSWPVCPPPLSRQKYLLIR